jgi:hypothetical protein
MRNLFSSRRTLTIAGSLVAIVSIAVVAQAATDTIYKYTTPKIGSFSMSPVQLSPNADNIDYSSDLFAGGRITVWSGSGCFSTGVNLPQGATMTGLTTSWSSVVGAGGAPSYILVRSTLNNGMKTLVAKGDVPDDTSSRKLFKANVLAGTELVNNHQHFYTLEICMGTNDVFYGGRIAYTYTHAGD